MVRPSRNRDVELRGTLLARRSLARRIEQLTAEKRGLESELEQLTRELAPHLLDEPGVGPLAAAQLLLSSSHPGRVRSEAAFARLAGCTPIPASSGQTVRYRLDRSGDRQLNRATHMILISRRRWHQPTIDYIATHVDARTARRPAKRTAASSATSPATSTACSSIRQGALDFHRTRRQRSAGPVTLNVRQIQELLGHKHVGSTRRYTRVSAHELRGAVKRLHFVVPRPRRAGFEKELRVAENAR